MKLKYYLFAVFCALICSCSVPKDVVYFQGIDSLSPEQLDKMSQSYSNEITYDDLLAISVTAWDPSAVTPFNPPTYAYSQQGEEPVVASPALYTYLVDKEGDINFPVLGKIHVVGLSKQQLSEKMEQMISKYVENPLVKVQLLNFKVTLMGEFNRPGTYTIKNDRLTVLDAIGLAGDLPMTANRTNILVIRENEGKKEINRLDLTNPEIFDSPYFFLRQNDVVYIEPTKSKQKSRSTSSRQFNISLFSSIVGTLSIISSMVISVVSLSKN